METQFENNRIEYALLSHFLGNLSWTINMHRKSQVIESHLLITNLRFHIQIMIY